MMNVNYAIRAATCALVLHGGLATAPITQEDISNVSKLVSYLNPYELTLESIAMKSGLWFRL